MLEIRLEANRLSLRCPPAELKPRHLSQLTFWGFRPLQEDVLVIDDAELKVVLPKIIAYIDKERLPYDLDGQLTSVLQYEKQCRDLLRTALDRTSKLKGGSLNVAEAREFLDFISRHIPRRLKEHQIKAALHLLAATNGANFSTPGSGKTTVVLTTFERLRHLGEIDSLFVAGPPACFAPWIHEYTATLGKAPRYQVMAGGDVDSRRSGYFVTRDTAYELYLTSFQTLQNDWPHVRTLFQRQGVRFFFVVDEAHYIKQLGGTWAEAVLTVAKEATRRCVLTGTPFPRALSDAFNLFEVLWPTASPLCSQDKHRIEHHIQRKEHSAAVDILDRTIGPLFYRVRKADLGLAAQVFHEPICITMNRHERCIYDSILDRISAASMSDFFKNFEVLVNLRRGRMTRLRQCISYAALLSTAVSEYEEGLVESDITIADMIKQYDSLEIPGKVEAAIALVGDLVGKGDKVIVWSNFVGTLKLLVRCFQGAGCGVGLIYGGTPFERAGVADELARERVVRSFCDPSDPMNVLVANPAACAESISLHKACSHAVYYDLSYNCAQYLQSLDRIHRVGGSEDKESHYYFLQYKDSLDDDILRNVRSKAQLMSAVIDRDYAVYSLDMFAEDEELEAYERIFGQQR